MDKLKKLLEITPFNYYLGSLYRLWIISKQPFVKIVFSGEKHYCPLCQNKLRTFLPAGIPTRPYALCPICHSLERHRLDWLFFQSKTNLFDESPKRLLHVAPEFCLERRFRKIINVDYLSADLHSPCAMLKMDITNIQFDENSFDAIYCSHVLEHIPNDRKAISELYRVLKPGGFAVLRVPVSGERTFEDPRITSSEEREKVYGHPEHVRICGPDYIKRMKSAGFNTITYSTTEIVDTANCYYMGIQQNRLIFYCDKK